MDLESGFIACRKWLCGSRVIPHYFFPVDVIKTPTVNRTGAVGWSFFSTSSRVETNVGGKTFQKQNSVLWHNQFCGQTIRWLLSLMP